MSNGIIGGNTLAIGLLTVNLNPASVAANTTAEQTFTVNGLQLGDFVRVTKPTLNAGLGIVNVRVSAANTLAITFANNTASPIDAAAENYLLFYVRPENNNNNVVTTA